MRLTFLTTLCMIILYNGFWQLHALRIIRGVWRRSNIPTVALPPTSNVWRPRPASVAAFEINAHCGVMGQRGHHHRSAGLGLA
jgi:hypothetical protein